MKRLTLFAVDCAAGSVVIGPVPFGDGAAPTIEFGGHEQLTVRGKTADVDYEPRPWMGPALEDEIEAGTIPSAWEGIMHE